MVAIIAINAFVALIPVEAKAKVGDVCKVEQIDCPGWGTGDRQICHKNATGVVCTCGDSTICPET